MTLIFDGLNLIFKCTRKHEYQNRSSTQKLVVALNISFDHLKPLLVPAAPFSPLVSDGGADLSPSRVQLQEEHSRLCLRPEEGTTGRPHLLLHTGLRWWGCYGIIRLSLIRLSLMGCLGISSQICKGIPNKKLIGYL